MSEQGHPEKESVLLDFGITMNIEADDPDGIRLTVYDAEGRKVIGFLRFSRHTWAELLASRANQPGTWQQYRR